MNIERRIAKLEQTAGDGAVTDLITMLNEARRRSEAGEPRPRPVYNKAELEETIETSKNKLEVRIAEGWLRIMAHGRH